MKIIAYKMVRGMEAIEIAFSADKAIKEGWQPYGFPFMGHGGYMLQAMVKFEETCEESEVMVYTSGPR